MPESPATRDLKSLFCERFKCPPSEYERLALRECLYVHARIIAPLLCWLNPRFFERDRVFIEEFGKAENWLVMMEEVAAFRYQDAFDEPRFTRKTLRLRVSGQKATMLADKLFPM